MTTLTSHRVIPLAQARGPQACAGCGLRSQAICSGVPETGWPRWQAERADTRLSVGDRLCAADAPLDAIYVVRSGVLKLERLTDTGERRVVRLATTGQAVGLEALSGECARGSLVALTEVSMCRLPVTAAKAWQQAHPPFAQAVSRALQAEIDDAYHWMTEFQVGTLRRRLLLLLLECQRLFNGARIVLPSREDLGAMLGVTLETTSRAVSDLRRSGALIAQGRGEFLLDSAMIRTQLAQFCAPARVRRKSA
jgi:CRP/FNR family transcriptional regulator, anaerobic regulatory protein